MDSVKNTHCNLNRPGGFIITDRAFNFCSFREGANILDLGCGSGATVDYLRKKYKFQAYGLDKNPAPFYNRINLFKAKAEKIPLPAASLDGVLMECSFSIMDDQEEVLKESHRVLKSHGRLLISDMYARGETAQLTGFLGRIDSKEGLVSKIETNGFTIDYFEDFSDHMYALWGQMIFEKGAESFYSDLGMCAEPMKQIKCGYCLVIATRKEKTA